MGGWRYRLGKLRSISGRDRLDLLVAQAALLRALILVRTRPVGTLLRRPPDRPRPTEPVDLDRLEALALAVERAAEHGLFRATCLVRAVALEHLARRAGAHHAVVRIGVAPGQDRLDAHAWIEVDGRVLGDRPEAVRRFTALSELSTFSS